MSGAQSFGRGRTSLETDMVRSGYPGVRRGRDNPRADSDTDHASCTQHEPVAHTGQQTQSITSAKFVTSAELAELVHPVAELTDLNTRSVSQPPIGATIVEAARTLVLSHGRTAVPTFFWGGMPARATGSLYRHRLIHMGVWRDPSQPRFEETGALSCIAIGRVK